MGLLPTGFAALLVQRAHSKQHLDAAAGTNHRCRRRGITSSAPRRAPADTCNTGAGAGLVGGTAAIGRSSGDAEAPEPERYPGLVILSNSHFQIPASALPFVLVLPPAAAAVALYRQEHGDAETRRH